MLEGQEADWLARVYEDHRGGFGWTFLTPLHNEPNGNDEGFSEDFNTTIANANEFPSAGGPMNRTYRTKLPSSFYILLRKEWIYRFVI